MTMILLITCFKTPYDIAFINDPPMWNKIIDYVIDFLFLLDIIIIFNTAFYDDDIELVDSRKTIFLTYFKGWFFIDLFSCIPTDDLLDEISGYNNLARITRVGRLYKLVKLTRLLRLLKIIRDRNRLLKYITEFLKVGLGFERLFFFVLIFVLLVHIACCLFVFVAQGLDDKYDGSWVEMYFAKYSITLSELDDTTLYVGAIYWTITTIATVGYGDIVAVNTTERIFCSVAMIIGVLAFTFANGSFASIL